MLWVGITPQVIGIVLILLGLKVLQEARVQLDHKDHRGQQELMGQAEVVERLMFVSTKDMAITI
jgi:hypothetical protein